MRNDIPCISIKVGIHSKPGIRIDNKFDSFRPSRLTIETKKRRNRFIVFNGKLVQLTAIPAYPATKEGGISAAVCIKNTKNGFPSACVK